jgi:hypothetical protein
VRECQVVVDTNVMARDVSFTRELEALRLVFFLDEAISKSFDHASLLIWCFNVTDDVANLYLLLIIAIVVIRSECLNFRFVTKASGLVDTHLLLFQY